MPPYFGFGHSTMQVVYRERAIVVNSNYKSTCVRELSNRRVPVLPFWQTDATRCQTRASRFGRGVKIIYSMIPGMDGDIENGGKYESDRLLTPFRCRPKIHQSTLARIPHLLRRQVQRPTTFIRQVAAPPTS
jgi:hypothetical protein